MIRINKASYFVSIFLFASFVIFTFYKVYYEQVYESFSKWKVDKNTVYTTGEIIDFSRRISLRSGRSVYYLQIGYSVKGLMFFHKIRNPKSNRITPETRDLYKFKVAYCKDDPKWSVIILPDSLKENN